MTYLPGTTSPSASFRATVFSCSTACRVCSLPSRSTVRVAGPTVCRMRSESVAQSSTRCPSKATILSPSRRPAALAGETGSEALQVSRFSLCSITHRWTPATSVVWVWKPKVMATPMKIATARTRFMNGPANITITRFQGLRV